MEGEGTEKKKGMRKGKGWVMGKGRENIREGRGRTRPHPFTPPIHISGYAPDKIAS